jgi:hypothetical protein
LQFNGPSAYFNSLIVIVKIKMTVDSTTEDVANSIEPEMLISHFWFCAYPYFEPVVYFIPETGARLEGDSEQIEESGQSHAIRVLDCDGALINEIEAEFPKHKLGWIECEPLLAGCKFESGIKHGTLEVKSRGRFKHKLGLLSARQPLLFVPMRPLVKNVGEFFPLYYNNGRKVYLAASNQSEKEVSIRCRLVVQQRSPEIELKIPARASRVFSVWDAFSEAFEVGTQDGVLSYLRCNLKGEGQVCFTMLEVQEQKGQHNFEF